MTSSIDSRIVERYDQLSPQERRAADTLLDHLGDLATYRATELASMAGVSKATMSRLFRRLGYDDFEGLREDLRQLRVQGFPVAIEPLPDLRGRLDQEVTNLQRTYAALDEPTLDAVTEALTSARRVLIVGQRSSYPVAVSLRLSLSQLRDDVRLAPQPGQSLSEDLVGLGAGDVAVVVAFRRRPDTTGAVLDALRDAGVPVLLVGDPTARALLPRATWWIECPLASPGAFDSHTTGMSLVALLADRVLGSLDDAEDRIEAIDRSYLALREIEGR